MLLALKSKAFVTNDAIRMFPFRPWVRRAGWSIVAVAAGLTVAIAGTLLLIPSSRYGWVGEPFVWAYVATLWIGGVKVWLGTRHFVAQMTEETLTLRPLHQLHTRVIRWEDVSGTEQMMGGDRLVVYFDTRRGMRFVALNLNLVKGRREFLTMLDSRLVAMGFGERLVERSRYLTRSLR